MNEVIVKHEVRHVLATLRLGRGEHELGSRRVPLSCFGQPRHHSTEGSPRYDSIPLVLPVALGRRLLSSLQRKGLRDAAVDKKIQVRCHERSG